MDSEDAILRWLEPDESGASRSRHARARFESRATTSASWFVSSPSGKASTDRVTARLSSHPRALPFAPLAASLLSRTLTDPVLTGIPFVDAHGAMRAGQLVEVCGVGGSGKTEILMQAAVNCALPREREGVRFGGCESSVLLLDLDGKFDTLRLLKILTARVEAALVRETARRARSSGSDGEPDAPRLALARLSDSVYRESVGRFQMVRCHNSLDFLKALAVVDKIFERRESVVGTARETNPDATNDSYARGAARDGVGAASAAPRRLLLVDNVAAFYWLDRASRRDHDAPLSLHNVHHASALALIEISRRCRAPVVATKAVAATSTTAPRDGGEATSSERARTTHKDFLPPRWTSAVTQRLVLEPEPLGTPRARRLGEDGATRDDADGGARFQGRGGVGTSFVARWELPAGRPSARYRVDGEAGIRTVG